MPHGAPLRTVLTFRAPFRTLRRMGIPSAGDDFAVLDGLFPVASRDVLDVGCGDGGLVRQLAGAGARAVGLEVSRALVDAARTAEPGAGGTYVVGAGERLPFPDGSFDLVVYMKALHHVPSDDMGLALAEAQRMLRPDGAVYVVEPATTGSFFALMRRVEDEMVVRTQAQAAILASALVVERTVTYDARRAFPDYAAFRQAIVRVDPRRAAVLDAEETDLRRAFAAQGTVEGDLHVFEQPMIVHLLRPPAA